MKFLNDEEFDALKNEYPDGTRIRLIHMPDDPFPIPDNTLGTVRGVTRANQLIVAWDNGSSLSLIIGVDIFEKIS